MNIADKILEIVKQEIKAPVSQEYHIVDVSYNMLKKSDPSLSNDRYAKILATFSQELKPANSLLDTVELVQTKPGNYLVEDPTHGTYVVGKSYNSLKRIIGKILQQVDIDSGLSGTEEDNNLDGELIPVGSKKPLLSNKLNSLLVRLPLQTVKPILKDLKELQDSYFTKVEYSFKSSKSTELLGKATVVLTISSAASAKEFAKAQKRVIANVTQYLNSPEFVGSVLTSKTGKKQSIIEGIEEEVFSPLLRKTPQTSTSKTTSQALSKTKTRTRTTSSNSTIKLRNKNTGQFYSLSSLQRLLSLAIGLQVAKNMGNGYRKDILNFRSGRFARSVSIERLTQSRAGQITAFYTYMKYPYQTFEPGYAQGHIGTRNPRLLISKSIREIAATAVANRLRAVLV